LQKIFTFCRPQNIFYCPQTNFSTCHDYISKSQKINPKSTDHSGIRTQSTIIFKLFAYHSPIRCFFPLEFLITMRKVTDINLKRSIIEKILENGSDRNNSTHHSNTKKRHFGTIVLINHNKIPTSVTNSNIFYLRQFFMVGSQG